VAVLKAFALSAALALAVTPIPASAQAAHAKAHRAIATQSEAAQAAFDRGLSMLYAFNVGEARVAFRTAESADSRAVLAYAGEAIADTIDINSPSTDDGEKRGALAVARGRANASDASSDDRAFLDAVAQRYDSRKPLKARYAAYFAAMQQYANAHPADGMAHTLAAFAGWNAIDTFADDKHELTASGVTVRDDLIAAIALDPDDLGAHHLLIHFWEEAGHPERALPDANYLAALSYDPGQSHLPHMAGHTYARTGDYDALVAANEAALENDEAYFALGNGPGQEYMQGYHDHDVEFVLYGLTTTGRNLEALMLSSNFSIVERGYLALRLHGANASKLLSTGNAAGVVAEARAGDLAGAQRDLAALAKEKRNADDVALPRAAIERIRHEYDAAIRDYRTALRVAGPSLGDPKHYWELPIGEGLGATLLEAHRYAEAETAFTNELVRYPNDPHLYFGLAEAQKGLGKDDSVERNAYAKAWKSNRPLTVADLG
jgi:tetratricopeptide (TPR) repeat protein